MPVIEVKTLEEYKRYEDIWIPTWSEQGYCLECYITKGVKDFVFYGTHGDYGSLQFVPYKTDANWPVNKDFPFHEFKELHNKKVIEIEKLAIKKEKRGSIKSLLEIFSFITSESFKQDIDYIISLINPDVYEVLLWRLKLPIKRLIKVGYEELPYYPIIIDTNLVRNTKFGKRILKQQEKIFA